jgi:hypothetical protein
MNKEEYTKKWPMDEIPDNIRELAVAWGEPFNLFIEDTVKLARDILEATEKNKLEYAKQRSIAFAEWMNDQDCQMTSDGWVRRPLYDAEFITIEKLYQIFTEHINK